MWLTLRPPTQTIVEQLSGNGHLSVERIMVPDLLPAASWAVRPLVSADEPDTLDSAASRAGLRNGRVVWQAVVPKLKRNTRTGQVGRVVADLDAVDTVDRKRQIRQRTRGGSGHALSEVISINPISDLQAAGADAPM